MSIIKKYLEQLYHHSDHNGNKHRRVRSHDIHDIAWKIAHGHSDNEVNDRLNRPPYKFNKFNASNVNSIEKVKQKYEKYKQYKNKDKVG